VAEPPAATDCETGWVVITGAAAAELTVSVAEELVTLPAELEITTEKPPAEVA
jgi:hypothetical protein